MSFARTMVVTVFVAALTACGGTNSGSSKATVNVGPGGNLVFAPAEVTISAGGTVTWQWDSSILLDHNVVSNTANLFRSGDAKHDGAFSHTFANVGDFAYHCEPHMPGMAGVVHVVP